jgi:hypothetical protein
MLVQEEAPARILKLNTDLLPSTPLRIDQSLGGTVRKCAANAFDVEAKFLAEQSEKKNDPELVNRSTL